MRPSAHQGQNTPPSRIRQTSFATAPVRVLRGVGATSPNPGDGRQTAHKLPDRNDGMAAFNTRILFGRRAAPRIQCGHSSQSFATGNAG